ncbi:MAG: Crp/Fnr family transcriptional regulator, partial [Gammaproteobacteria bacterium]|nr:Crp/Fnr family transcriptional regulator [Gammaproteobacteria bacterium]NIY33543.1 Crp/Fnr family transcriptional regulator [Gammaproteobacteria bacterium]
MCQLPFQPLESLATRIPTLQKRIVRIISQELRNEQSGLMGAPHG